MICKRFHYITSVRHLARRDALTILRQLPPMTNLAFLLFHGTAFHSLHPPRQRLQFESARLAKRSSLLMLKQPYVSLQTLQPCDYREEAIVVVWDHNGVDQTSDHGMDSLCWDYSHSSYFIAKRYVGSACRLHRCFLLLNTPTPHTPQVKRPSKLPFLPWLWYLAFWRRATFLHSVGRVPQPRALPLAF